MTADPVITGAALFQEFRIKSSDYLNAGKL